MATSLEKRLAAKQRLTPREGFHVVAVDDYEEPGKELYLIGRYKDRQQAEMHASSHTEETGEKTFVYEPERSTETSASTDRLIYRIAYRLARGRYQELLAEFANVIVAEDKVDPQKYYQEHGRCPRGFHWGGKRCQPVDKKVSEQPRHEEEDPKAKRRRRQQERKQEAQIAAEGIARLSKEGKLKGSPKQHFTQARDLLRKHAARIETVLGELQDLAPEMKVKGRVKTVGSAVGKVVRDVDEGEDRKSVEELRDLTGTRMVGDSLDEVWRAVDAVKNKYKVIKEKNLINEPRDDGYRSYHVIIEDADGLPKEVQIRTRNQDVWADWAHDVYKPVNEAQRRAIQNPKVRSVIDSFSKQMADWLAAEDAGKSVDEPPPCPPEVEKIFGCPPA